MAAKNSKGDGKRPDPTSLARAAVDGYRMPRKKCYSCHLPPDAAACLAEFVALKLAGQTVPVPLVYRVLHDNYGFSETESALRNHLKDHVPGWRA
jgi:hypothetical protein